MREIVWPVDIPESILPDDLSTDPFYEAVVAKKEEGTLTLNVNLCAEIQIPLELLEAQDSATVADDVATMVVERMLLEIKTDVLPLTRRRVEDALRK